MTQDRVLSLAFDTETTGMIDWKANDLSLPHQPHVLQLGAILFDDETGEIVDTIDTLIKPDRWIENPAEDGKLYVIHPKALEAHGISLERCEAEGRPMLEVLPEFNAMKRRAKRRVAFNLKFDKQMMARAALHLSQEHESYAMDDFDVMLKSIDICKIPKADGKKGNKWPKLSEAYMHFFGKQFEGAHSAMGDSIATKEIYMIIKTPIMEPVERAPYVRPAAVARPEFKKTDLSAF